VRVSSLCGSLCGFADYAATIVEAGLQVKTLVFVGSTVLSFVRLSVELDSHWLLLSWDWTNPQALLCRVRC
jgi:hypothetical protein